MGWYVNHLADAQALASRQGYRGARWPKMATMSTTDLPSPIAPLLIWQQPHVAWYLECCYGAHPDRETLLKYRDVMFETAESVSPALCMFLKCSHYQGRREKVLDPI